MVIKYYVNGTSADTLYVTQKNQCMNYTCSGRGETESGGTRRRTGGEVKGKEANGVGSQQSSA